MYLYKAILIAAICLIASIVRADKFKVKIDSDSYKIISVIDVPYKSEYEVMNNSLILIPRANTLNNFFFFMKTENGVIFIPLSKINHINLEKVK